MQNVVIYRFLSFIEILFVLIDNIRRYGIINCMNNTLPDIQKQLIKAGLSEKESAIYAALLHLGGAYPSKIAEITKINRSTVYKILLDLSVKGLVNEIEKKNKIFYQVENPNRLIRYAKDKVTIAKDALEKTERMIPDIEQLYNVFAHKPKVTYFEGLENVIHIYEDHLQMKQPYEMLAWSNTQYIENLLKLDFFFHYRKTKEAKKITTRAIVPDTLSDKSFVHLAYEKIGIAETFWPVARFVPVKEFSVSGEITIYGEDKVSIVNLNKDTLTGTLIQDKTIHDMMKMIFELSWKGAEK